MLRYKIILLIVLASWHFTAVCQPVTQSSIIRCAVKTINFEQGLINNTITEIITDPLGLTWISTLTGLQRFNGVAFVKITPVVGSDTIRINYPVYFLAEKNGSILIGYKKGVLEYSPITNSFSKKITVDPLANLHYAVVPVKETEEGLLCLQQNKGLIIYNPKGGVNFSFSSKEAASIDSLIYTGEILYENVLASNDQFLFIRNYARRILQFNFKTHQVSYILNNNDPIFGIDCNSDKIFLTSAKGLSLIDIKTAFVSSTFSFQKLANEDSNYSYIRLTGDNKLLVSSGRRLYEFDTAGDFKREFRTLNRDPIIANGYIMKPYEDRFKRIWLLTNDDMKRIEDFHIPFDHFLYQNEKNNFVRAVYYDEKKHIILAGCFNGGIQLYDSSGNALWGKPIITNDVRDILFIEKTSSENYLIITIRKGWYILNLPTKKLERIDFSFTGNLKERIENNHFSNTLQRINDTTIITSTRSNIFRCIIKKDKVVSVTSLLDSVNVLYPINCFVYAHDHVMWVGSFKGVVYRIRENGEINAFNIPDNYVIRCMMEDVAHNIWVGTEKGLYIYSAKGKLIKQFTRESGLLNDFIYSLQQVDSNLVFASTNMGLSSISNDGAIKNYTKELGLQENEFNTQSFARSASGKLFFGGVNGISAFYPNELSGFNDTAIINITRLIIDDSLYNSSAGIWGGDSLDLSHYQNHLQIDISASGILNPNEYIYQYRLKNFEEKWQTAHEPTALRYTLEPGKYFLQIKCSPLLSPNTYFEKQISITVNDPWWQTWWFRIIAFLVIIAAIGLIILQYNRRKYLAKIRLLQVQNEVQQERERISKELHDNIGTQLSYISSNVDWILDAPYALNKDEESNRLRAINATAKDMISDLRETIWAIKKESILLDEMADKLKLFIQSQRILQPAMQVNISENLESNTRFSPTDALNIFRICQEAIVNSLKHSGASMLNVALHSNSHQNFLIIIEDNGKGFTQKKEYNGHYGLSNMRSRAKELGAKIDIVSAEDKGTKIEISR